MICLPLQRTPVSLFLTVMISATLNVVSPPSSSFCPECVVVYQMTTMFSFFVCVCDLVQDPTHDWFP